jgi:proline iminopeptidase
MDKHHEFDHHQVEFVSYFPNRMYPISGAFKTEFLAVSPIHTLHVQQYGNPNGSPLIFLHGGPGGGFSDKDTIYFDPKHYRIVIFDQRGSGKSTPFASLVDNTTWSLVEDIEKIRVHLSIEKWVVFGGSWGSTLALCYTISHAIRVKGLILRGIFMLRQQELNWFYQISGGALMQFPDYWEKYIEVIPVQEREDMISAYYKRLTGSDKVVQMNCARAWSTWECATSRLFVDPEMIAKAATGDWSLAFAMIECHYFVNKGFFECDDYILKNAHKLQDIPGVIVQGRYDAVCPMKSAYDLSKIWPKAYLDIVPDAGHSAREEGTQQRLKKYADEFRKY